MGNNTQVGNNAQVSGLLKWVALLKSSSAHDFSTEIWKIFLILSHKSYLKPYDTEPLQNICP